MQRQFHRARDPERADAPPRGDLIFISIDDRGAPGALNQSVLRQLRLDAWAPT